MDARKLVGMTQGARKRAARNEDDYTRSAEYLFQRTKYRIGQRLRPCPGCRKCGYEPTVTLWKLSRDAMWMSGSLVVRDIRNICDGSGVIPAKARKVRR